MEPRKPLRELLSAKRRRAVKRRLLRPFFVDLASAPTAFVAGSGRSGTTWVEDLINHRGDHRIVFEPFWGRQVPSFRHFNERQYLRPGDESPRFLDPVRQVLDGKLRSAWTDQMVDRLIYRRRLIKDIRASLFLNWLHHRFQSLPIVFVMRHPCAVVTSQLKLRWQPELDQALDQPELVQDFLAPFMDVLQSVKGEFERAIAFWCVENYVVLKQFAPDEVLLVFYEEALRQPEHEMQRLFGFLQQPLDAHLFEHYSRPSEQTRTDSAICTGEDPVSAWRKQVTAVQVQRAVEILAAFGLDRIYAEDPIPNSVAARQMLAGNAHVSAQP
jgi:sulfotransferase family protein